MFRLHTAFLLIGGRAYNRDTHFDKLNEITIIVSRSAKLCDVGISRKYSIYRNFLPFNNIAL